MLLGGHSYEVRALGNEIAVNGHRFEIVIEDPRQWKLSDGAEGAQGRAQITAPMPGKVVRLLVAVGDEVVAGRPVVVVEAMKMQNELKAPRDGRVTSVRVEKDQSVNAGTILLVIE